MLEWSNIVNLENIKNLFGGEKEININFITCMK